jgi:tricorn protease
LLGHEKKLSNKEEFMKTARLSALIFSILLLFSVTIFGIQDARLLRTPDINGDLVVFVYAGDIWSVSANGGAARRLTSHEGLEIFPKISPDGKWIAFSAEYSGSRQIYLRVEPPGSSRITMTWE